MRDHGYDNSYISNYYDITRYDNKLIKKSRKVNIAEGLIGCPECEFLDYSLFRSYNDTTEIEDTKFILNRRRSKE